MGSIDKACISGFLCRLCSEMHRTVIHIYGEQGKRHGLVEKINGYLPITVSPHDPLPKTICETCLRRVEQHYELLSRLTEYRETKLLKRNMGELRPRVLRVIRPLAAVSTVTSNSVSVTSSTSLVSTESSTTATSSPVPDTLTDTHETEMDGIETESIQEAESTQATIVEEDSTATRSEIVTVDSSSPSTSLNSSRQPSSASELSDRLNRIRNIIEDTLQQGHSGTTNRGITSSSSLAVSAPIQATAEQLFRIRDLIDEEDNRRAATARIEQDNLRSFNPETFSTRNARLRSLRPRIMSLTRSSRPYQGIPNSSVNVLSRGPNSQLSRNLDLIVLNLSARNITDSLPNNNNNNNNNINNNNDNTDHDDGSCNESSSSEVTNKSINTNNEGN